MSTPSNSSFVNKAKEILDKCINQDTNKYSIYLDEFANALKEQYDEGYTDGQDDGYNEGYFSAQEENEINNS